MEVLLVKKISLILCLLLCGLFVIGGTASAAGKKPMDREKAVTGLYNNFLYDKDELGKYFDSGITYMELKKMCLHAYAAKKPLAEVVQLREKYVWTRTDYLLGLTPEKLAKAEMEYKADRLQRLFGLDKKLVKKYMKLGYASHQVKRAMFIASHCDKTVEEILAMKTRQQKWGDICEQLGLSREACMK